MTSKAVRAKFERTSFGTPHAQAARRSVAASDAAKVVARSEFGNRTIAPKSSKKSGG
jgi:hypothetical protein